MNEKIKKRIIDLISDMKIDSYEGIPTYSYWKHRSRVV